MQRFLIILLVLGMMTGATACNKVRRLMGMEEKIEYIEEEHLAPCRQPHMNFPRRNCSGEQYGYTQKPVQRHQDF